MSIMCIASQKILSGALAVALIQKTTSDSLWEHAVT